MSAPDPLVSIEVDLRDFEFLPMDARRLLASDTWIAAAKDPRVGHAVMSLWLESWHQVPAGSLPNRDDVLMRLSMCPNEKEWRRVRERVLAGFVLCADGRYYHPVVAEKALEAWSHRKTQSAKGKAGARKRWGTRSTGNATAIAQAYHGHSPGNGTGNAHANAQAMPGDSKRHGHGSSEAKASGADAPPDDPDKALWRLGVRILTEAGVLESNARGILGKHFKADKVKLAQVLGEMAVNRPIEPVAYLQRAMQPPERKVVI